MAPLLQDIWQGPINSTEEDKMDDLVESIYPEITLETDDILMSITVKKDYSQIEDSDKRKEEFINDLNEFIKEFSETPESREFVAFLD